MTALSILPLRAEDLPFARTMLYEAVRWRGPEHAPPMEQALADPTLARYLTHWGRPGDAGLILRVGDVPAGAVWLRRFAADAPGFGFVDAETPELSIAVTAGLRGRGIGRSLLTVMLTQARLTGLAAVSLSVEVDNPARTLYEQCGFVTVATVEGSVTMLLDLHP